MLPEKKMKNLPKIRGGAFLFGVIRFSFYNCDLSTPEQFNVEDELENSL